MDRKQAQALVGTRVSAWTAANGVYVGTLREVTDHRPWRGVVLIDGIVSPANCWERGRGFRRGKRVGETIEVGGVNIEATEAIHGTDYVASLEAEAADFERRHADYLAGDHGDPHDATVARLYAWTSRAAADVRAAVARLREEDLPWAERVDVDLDGDRIEVTMPGRDEALSKAADALRGWGRHRDPTFHLGIGYRDGRTYLTGMAGSAARLLDALDPSHPLRVAFPDGFRPGSDAVERSVTPSGRR